MWRSHGQHTNTLLKFVYKKNCENLYDIISKIYTSRNENSKLYKTIQSSGVLDKNIKIIINQMTHENTRQFEIEGINQKNLNELKNWLKKFSGIKGGHFTIWTKNIQESIKRLSNENIEDKVNKVKIQKIDSEISKKQKNIQKLSSQDKIEKQKELILNEMKQKLKLIKTNKKYQITQKGKEIYMPDPVQDVNIENTKKEDLKKYLEELCKKAGITEGLATDNERQDGKKDDIIDENGTGYKQSAYDYFFTEKNDFGYSNMYEQISEYYQDILAKCILIMYKNMNNSKWKEIIATCIWQLSSHGGHCQWRAEAIINTVNDLLVNFLRDNIKTQNKPKDDDCSMEDMFCKLKESIVKSEYKSRLTKYDRSNDEALGKVNKEILNLKYLLGMPGGQNIKSNDIDLKFNFKAMDLIKIPYEILDKTEDYKREPIIEEADKIEISFLNYCQYTAKSYDFIELMLNKICSTKTEEADELISWIVEDKYLFIGTIFGDLCEIFGYDGSGILEELKYASGLKFLIKCVEDVYLKLV